MTIPFRIALGAAALLLIAVPVHADGPTPQPPNDQSGREAPTTPAETAAEEAAAGDPESARTESGAGLRVYVDPETGRRTSTPTAAQRGKLEAAIARQRAFDQSSEGLVELPAPGGGTLVHLQGRFQSSSTVTRNADGSLVFGCTDPLHADLDDHDHTPAPRARDER